MLEFRRIGSFRFCLNDETNIMRIQAKIAQDPGIILRGPTKDSQLWLGADRPWNLLDYVKVVVRDQTSISDGLQSFSSLSNLEGTNCDKPSDIDFLLNYKSIINSSYAPEAGLETTESLPEWRVIQVLINDTCVRMFYAYCGTDSEKEGDIEAVEILRDELQGALTLTMQDKAEEDCWTILISTDTILFRQPDSEKTTEVILRLLPNPENANSLLAAMEFDAVDWQPRLFNTILAPIEGTYFKL